MKIEASSVDNQKTLYAQPTANGFQLIDSSPKVIFKIYNSSRNDCFIATKSNIQGVLIEKNNQWFFEYYQNDALVSEKVAVKF
jgi:allophanate hydrolase subunit 1